MSAEERVAAAIAAAAERRARTAADRARRKLARDHGLRARHRQKLLRLQQQQPPDTPQEVTNDDHG
jgi:hypothetical protein